MLRYSHFVFDLEELTERRRRNWCQTEETRVPDPEAAKGFIERLGIATLYAASPEFPSLYQAHMGDPNPPTFATWASPSGYVYTWRWELGRPHTAFYGVVVARKPTWVTFDRLPVVLGALMERRSPEELYERGELSADGLRVAKAFEETSGVLSTKDLRARAGFEKGKESRAGYLRAVEELDSRLWLAKRFLDEEEGEMQHALVSAHYPEATRAAFVMNPVDALTEMLEGVLRQSVYLDLKPLSRHLRVEATSLRTALDQLQAKGIARAQTFGKTTLYIATQEQP